MKFQNGHTVIVLDTTQKPAGTAVIISYNQFTRYYKVRLTYYDSEKEEEIDVPENRLLTYNSTVR